MTNNQFTMTSEMTITNLPKINRQEKESVFRFDYCHLVIGHYSFVWLLEFGHWSFKFPGDFQHA